ncbi:MAG: hypothetical protein E7453_06180 [Ruminococcaceae bacterium]|nr:hypothetical protein [Oscillospiraceae bacterium]
MKNKNRSHRRQVELQAVRSGTPSKESLLKMLNTSFLEFETKAKAIGFCGAAYNQIIVFQREYDFILALSANPHMEAIIGESEEEKRDFPGVYIAGIKREVKI